MKRDNIVKLAVLGLTTIGLVGTAALIPVKTAVSETQPVTLRAGKIKTARVKATITPQEPIPSLTAGSHRTVQPWYQAGRYQNTYDAFLE
ncbi:hypothetical protein FC83_GL002984 [Agrilactobacillus composti DSM 18527 = JCM 14202]|uniref:Uncharacterized protein n=1 Tax=Agrilactobacillus composti DSM 18527 = JCM 14202 TaxID=1423734 RepID=X0PEE7_9LACO|nr:hypothetical protein [Agrilactobacillus composti]KRM36233.1 hypothetical protein FC83_GL002984 [Agrilactobacillus composti DSM 18527 = JCM 14202]GAF39969.1 hypothetical protein JCM14202_1852 [Agrilactobacillus composti DSM 18527 = JCM 14202]